MVRAQRIRRGARLGGLVRDSALLRGHGFAVLKAIARLRFISRRHRSEREQAREYAGG